jgi:7-cyano-7-deazaguanine synthase
MEQQQKKAVVLVSGGLDSATVLAIARDQGYACYALSFNYGQRHAVELEAAKRVSMMLGAYEHRTATIDLRVFGGSALTSDVAVPKDRADAEMAAGIPITYVPARNTIFLSFALAWAEVLGAQAIFIGVNAVDYSGYPDCRPAFIEAYQVMASLATAASTQDGQAVQICTPLIHMTKEEIIRTGLALGVDYAQTISCYDPDGQGYACGHCDACALRRRGFEHAQITDPTHYHA